MVEQTTEIRIRNGAETALTPVEPISDGTFRVLAASWFDEDFDYDDLIEMNPIVDDIFQFVRVVAPSTLNRTTFLLSQETAGSPRLRTLLNEVERSDGYWERGFGGGVFVALPPETTIDINELFAEL